MSESYSCASGGVIAAGRRRNQFDSVSIYSVDGGVPYETLGQTLVVSLHGSGGQNTTSGRQYRAAVSGRLAYDTHNEFSFSTVRVTTNQFTLRPVDQYGTYSGGTRRESMWLGFKDAPDAVVRLMTERRLDAMMSWSADNLSIANHVKTCLTGGSMGGWGTLTYGLRRPTKFAAIYPDRPRWRYAYTAGTVAVAAYTAGLASVTVGAAPNLSSDDGGGSVAAYMDMTTYAGNVANDIPWVGWCVGRQDGFVMFSDHVDAVAALRTAKRGFAFAWNNGDHSAGSIISEITQSYPFGTFEIGKGYPLFTNHSGDQDPSVDLVGGINIGLSFRNVVESAGSWSCEVTSTLGARTVTVEPISKIFVTSVTPQNITIPAANTWVAVSF